MIVQFPEVETIDK